jgi:hypothetical protein
MRTRRLRGRHHARGNRSTHARLRLGLALLVGLVGAAAPIAGCAGSGTQTVAGESVREVPPPLRSGPRPPRPSETAVWVDGHWDWTGDRYAWNPGRWETDPPGRAWVPGYWKNTSVGWKWMPGRWEP